MFSPMAILLISWTCTSMVFCLAFLSVAARPVRGLDGQMAPGYEAALAQEPGAVLASVKTASLPAETALPLPCQAA